MKKLLATVGCALCFTGSLFMFGACGEGGGADLTKVNQQISQLEQQVSSLQSTITALQGQIGTSTGDTTLQAQITAMQTQLTAALGRLTVLENQLGGSETNSFYSIGDKVTYTVNGSKVFDIKVTSVTIAAILNTPAVHFEFNSYLGETSTFDNSLIKVNSALYIPSVNEVVIQDNNPTGDNCVLTYNSRFITSNTPMLLFIYSNTNLVAIYNVTFTQLTS